MWRVMKSNDNRTTLTVLPRYSMAQQPFSKL